MLGLGEPSVADNLPSWARSVGATATLFYCVEKTQSRLRQPSTHDECEGCKNKDRHRRPVRRHIRDSVIHGFDEKCADLALGTNPEIDRATIMPTTGRLGDPMRGRPSRGISSFFDIFREIQVELASRNSRVLHTTRI